MVYIKTELYRTNATSQGLVPAHFALIIIIVVHVYQARSGLLATGPAGGLGVSHGGGQGDKSVCGVRAAPRKISQFKVLKRPYSVEETDQRDLALARGLRRREAPT